MQTSLDPRNPKDLQKFPSLPKSKLSESFWMNARDAKTLLLASQPSTSQPKASPALPLPGSHVIAVPGWVDHDLPHTHRLLRAVILVQVVFSSYHTEGHLSAVTEEKI